MIQTCRFCDGLIDTKAMSIGIRTGCHSSAPAWPCPKCGLLHLNGMSPAATRGKPRKYAYLKNGKIENCSAPWFREMRFLASSWIQYVLYKISYHVGRMWSVVRTLARIG